MQISSMCPKSCTSLQKGLKQNHWKGAKWSSKSIVSKIVNLFHNLWSTRAKGVKRRLSGLSIPSLHRKKDIFTCCYTWLMLLMLAHLGYDTRAASLTLITVLSFHWKHQPTPTCIPMYCQRREKRGKRGMVGLRWCWVWSLACLLPFKEHQNTWHQVSLQRTHFKFTTVQIKLIFMFIFNYSQQVWEENCLTVLVVNSKWM